VLKNKIQKFDDGIRQKRKQGSYISKKVKYANDEKTKKEV